MAMTPSRGWKSICRRAIDSDLARFDHARINVDRRRGNDRFVLEEPRTGDVVPLGRIDSTSSGSGLIADYGSRLSENPTSRIEFSTFESADINLGTTNSIFTVFDTVIKRRSTVKRATMSSTFASYPRRPSSTWVTVTTTSISKAVVETS